ncbi:hypothetical protein OSB04_002509 [Centaurea solstitialis]|uniref:Uncharacterized protein n=1 Tax=Centaurea solstitialis TaxID=347529 RepID=A0AA38UBF7_9ASTR|nr:hypothetical protein OSB04_002509 [Centaurea solstitialis]
MIKHDDIEPCSVEQCQQELLFGARFFTTPWIDNENYSSVMNVKTFCQIFSIIVFEELEMQLIDVKTSSRFSMWLNMLMYEHMIDTLDEIREPTSYLKSDFEIKDLGKTRFLSYRIEFVEY